MRLIACYDRSDQDGVDVKSITYGEPRFNVVVETTGGLKLKIFFPEHVAHFVSDEGDRLSFVNVICALRAEIGQPLVYEILDSEFIAWFNGLSDGFRVRVPRRHFCVVTDNTIVDVIAMVEPAVEKIHSGV